MLFNIIKIWFISVDDDLKSVHETQIIHPKLITSIDCFNYPLDQHDKLILCMLSLDSFSLLPFCHLGLCCLIQHMKMKSLETRDQQDRLHALC